MAARRRMAWRSLDGAGLKLAHDVAALRACSPPPCGEGLGVGVGVAWAQQLGPPSPSLPHKGGGSRPVFWRTTYLNCTAPPVQHSIVRVQLLASLPTSETQVRANCAAAGSMCRSAPTQRIEIDLVA